MAEPFSCMWISMARRTLQDDYGSMQRDPMKVHHSSSRSKEITDAHN